MKNVLKFEKKKKPEWVKPVVGKYKGFCPNPFWKVSLKGVHKVVNVQQPQSSVNISQFCLIFTSWEEAMTYATDKNFMENFEADIMDGVFVKDYFQL